MNEERLVLRLLLARQGFLKFREKLVLEKRLETTADWRELSKSSLEYWIERGLRVVWKPDSEVRNAEADRRFLERSDFFVLFWDDPRYPEALREIADPPYALWGRGTVPDWGRCWTAIVGTRQPSEAAKAAARSLAFDLATAGVGVVSGLARGIDAWAHRGALEASVLGKAPTVGVLGQGIDWISPASNRNLARKILLDGGCLFSEYPPGTPARKHHFPARNRIVSGLCRTTVVVQAPRKSGALITADLALDQGRDVVVHEAGLEGERGEGSRALVEQGAPVLGAANELMELWQSGAVGLAHRQMEWNWGETEHDGKNRPAVSGERIPDLP